MTELTSSEYNSLSVEERLLERLKLAVQIIDLSGGSLIEPGTEDLVLHPDTDHSSIPSDATGSQKATTRGGGARKRKAHLAQSEERQKSWVVIDAEGLVLGRLASIVAMRLRGKHKATFTPHMDMGDNVIVVNAEKVKLIGNKRRDKTYYWHTGQAGGIKSRKADQLLDGKYPERVIQKAVQRMMPGGPLTRRQLTCLHVYAGPKHPHHEQIPFIVDLEAPSVAAPSNAVHQRSRSA